MKKILILSGLSLLVALAVRAQDKVTEYNVPLCTLGSGSGSALLYG